MSDVSRVQQPATRVYCEFICVVVPTYRDSIEWVKLRAESPASRRPPERAFSAHGAAGSGPIPSLPSGRRRQGILQSGDMGLGAAAGRLLAEVDWEREAYPAYDDFLALPAFVLFFPTVRFFFDRYVFEVRPPFRPPIQIRLNSSWIPQLSSLNHSVYNCLS
nr:unnamed protein product [Digitaria exilis]